VLAFTPIPSHLGNVGNEENAMFKRSVAVTFAAVAGLLLVAATPSPVRAAEIKLLSPFSFRALLPDLLPQFEKSSGHKVTGFWGRQ
jgi:hypothetical protein